MDCNHLKAKEREHLFTTLGYDKDTLPDFFIKKGYHLEGTMIEMTVSEPMQARPSEQCGSGIKIDEKCASNIPGLICRRRFFRSNGLPAYVCRPVVTPPASTPLITPGKANT